jgi:hypothetical protein
MSLATKLKLGLTTLVMENSPIWVPTLYLLGFFVINVDKQDTDMPKCLFLMNQMSTFHSTIVMDRQVIQSQLQTIPILVAMRRALNYYNFKYCSCNFTTKVSLILVKISPTIVSKILSSLGVTRILLVLAIFKTSSLGIFPFTKLYSPLKSFFLAMAHDGKKDLWKYQLPNILVMRL